MIKIPFNKPFIGKEEEQAIIKALRGGHLRGDGPYTKRVQQRMEEWLGVKHVLLTTSCTHALEMAMMILDIGPGDEVIMPSFNFVSSANAVVLRGANPIFADITPDTMNVDPEDIRRKVTERTKAIVPVHYAGVGCDMDTIMSIAEEYNLYIVEDAAQGVDAYYKKKPLGTIGDIGCYSFHDTKNITCGEGGAFLTNNDDLAAKAEIIREKGTNRAAFFRGEVDKYSWISKGSSYIPSDLLAAFLEVQLKKKDEIRNKRKKNWKVYYDTLLPLEEAGKLSLPSVPIECKSNYHIFFFHVPKEELQQVVIDSLKKKGIQATFHYVPLHTAPFNKQNGLTNNLEHTSYSSNTLIRLPTYPELTQLIGSVASDVYAEIKQILGK